MHEKVNPLLPMRLLRGVLCWLGACGLAASAQAQSLNSEPEFLSGARRWLDKTVAEMQASAAVPLRLEVSVGALDSRLRLASCAQVEPYIPAGSRLWGKSRLGLRCNDGVSRWNVSLPITVKAYGRAWVVRRDVAPGAVLGEGDLMVADVDWAEEASPIVADSAQWLGQVATRSLSTGQTLRQNMIRAAQVFQAGTQVRVVAQGPGFQITSDGQAVSAGVVGQPARVRMENGRIMSGVVLDARTVRLEI